MNLYQYTSSYRTKLIISVYKEWIKKGERIIDIGCGTGIVAKRIGDFFSAEISGCDVKNYLIHDIPFIKIKNNRLPVKDNFYDSALLNDVLHHINKDNQIEVVKEAARVAKKLFIFEFEPTLIGKFTDVILNKLHYGDLNAPLALRTKDEWQKLFKNLNFKVESVKLPRSFWYPFSHIAFMLKK